MEIGTSPSIPVIVSIADCVSVFGWALFTLVKVKESGVRSTGCWTVMEKSCTPVTIWELTSDTPRIAIRGASRRPYRFMIFMFDHSCGVMFCE